MAWQTVASRSRSHVRPRKKQGLHGGPVARCKLRPLGRYSLDHADHQRVFVPQQSSRGRPILRFCKCHGMRLKAKEIAANQKAIKSKTEHIGVTNVQIMYLEELL